MIAEDVVESCIRGYHYYQNIWDPVVDEVLACVREDGNPHDRYAIAVYKDTRVVGHVARKISTVCCLFLRKVVLYLVWLRILVGTHMICLKEAWKYHAYSSFVVTSKSKTTVAEGQRQGYKCRSSTEGTSCKDF